MAQLAAHRTCNAKVTSSILVGDIEIGYNLDQNLKYSHDTFPMSDIEIEQKGNLQVIEGTNVVLHDTEARIVGIAVFLEDEWKLVVPAEPTQSMLDAAKESGYDLPVTADELAEELEKAQEEIGAVHRKIEALGEVYQRLERLLGRI